MDCNSYSTKKPLELNQGSNEPIFIRITRQGRALNLVDITEAAFVFIGENHEKISIDLENGASIESAPDGVFRLDIPIETRALFKIEDRQSFAAKLTLGTDIREVRFEDCLNVIESFC